MTRRKRDSSWDGLLVVDKPQGVTSRDVVNAVQSLLPRGTRIGHTGTLDPLATGVLVLCVGQATRLAEYIQGLPKTYRARIRLGATSDTDDADGPITESPNVAPVEFSRIEQLLPRFLGEIDQVPPAYSAIKQDGERAYNRARVGQPLELAPRRVRIDEIRVENYAWPFLDLEIHCGKGTYIRALARDLGTALQVGGMIEQLRRTRVGPFEESQALPTADLHDIAVLVLRPLAGAVAHLPRCDITENEWLRLRHGQSLARPMPQGECAVFLGSHLVAIGRSDGTLVHPSKVFGTPV